MREISTPRRLITFLNKVDLNWFCRALVFSAWFLLAAVPMTCAQSVSSAPIRVVSDQVLVQVSVLDDRVADVLQKEGDGLPHDIDSGNFKTWSDLAYRGLVAKDFEVSEDRHKQTI